MTQTVLADRLETLLLARLALPGKTAPHAAALARLTQRFRPPTLTDAQWRELVTGALARLTAAQRITAERRLVDPGELARQLGPHAAGAEWEAWADKLLPAHALGLALDDSKALRRLSLRDGWMAAIAARALGLWTSPSAGPPSFKDLCDALVWRDLGLAGAPEPCPPGI
ncbi:MAG TPA: hypothetical protein VGC42_01360, partial [Kofleriaceae bacterium]